MNLFNAQLGLALALAILVANGTDMSQAADNKTSTAEKEQCPQLLPYPQEITFTGGSRTLGPLRVDATGNHVLLTTARESVVACAHPSTGASTDLRLGAAEDRRALAWLSPADRDFLAAETTSPGAYILRVPTEGRITIVGKTARGTLYGAQTFNQLLLNDPDRTRIPTCVVRDWPDLRWRCLSPSLTWYSGFNRLEGYDLNNWTLDEWKWLVDWSLLHKFNAWAVCTYGYWPFTLDGYPEAVLNVPSFFCDPRTGEKNEWRFTHPNIRQEFWPEVCDYARARGIEMLAYIGKNSFNGGYYLHHPDATAGGAIELLPFQPGVHKYWQAFTNRLLDMGFDGFVFEDPEAYHVPNQNEDCYRTFWAPWSKEYGFKSVKDTDANKPPLGVHIEYYTWLFRQFDSMIQKHARSRGRRAPIYLISHVLLSRIVGESKSDEERRRWFALVDEKHGRPIPFIVSEANEDQYVDFFGADRVASLGGRGGSCGCAWRRCIGVNNNCSSGPFGMGVDYERDCQRRIQAAGGFGAMAYVFEWRSTEIFGYIGSQYLWRSAGVPGINNDDQVGFLDYAYRWHYGDDVGALAAEALDLCPGVNDARILPTIHGAQYPETGNALFRDLRLMATLADSAYERAERAYRLYTGVSPDLLRRSYDPAKFRWKAWSAGADRTFKRESLRWLCVQTKRTQFLCRAGLNFHAARTLAAEQASREQILARLDEAISAAAENTRLYRFNFDDDYHWNEGLCGRLEKRLNEIRSRIAKLEGRPPTPDDLGEPAPLLHLDWQPVTEVAPPKDFRCPFLVCELGLNRYRNNDCLGVVFTVEVETDGKRQILVRRILDKNAQTWQPIAVSLADYAGRTVRLRFVADAYTASLNPQNLQYHWALWSAPLIVASLDSDADVLLDFAAHADEAITSVVLDADGKERVFTDRTDPETGAAFTPVRWIDIGEIAPDGAQTAEGFDRILGYGHAGGYGQFRGFTQSWWEYAGRDEEVRWQTAVCPDAKPTVFAFTGGVDYRVGEVELFVKNRRALTFRSGLDHDETWREGDYELRFLFRADTRAHVPLGYSGVFLLSVPARDIAAEQPLTLAARHRSGQGWFMLHDYRDTWTHLQEVGAPLGHDGRPKIKPCLKAWTPSAKGERGLIVGAFEIDVPAGIKR